ncbi:MAG TPA: hypothetical protein VD884_14265, partial [Ohtaekwangia sp.]|nr:hypothetical protein [Ohtaekwangia sp.]
MKQTQLHLHYAAITLLLVLYSNMADAQNYSGLLNKELSPDVSKETIVGGILEILTSGGQPEGTITRVKVLDDRDISLTVGITFTGYKAGYVHIFLTDEDLTTLKGFPVPKVAIEKDKKDVQLRIQLDPTVYKENETFEAARLVITVSKTEDIATGSQRIYKLNKKFNNPITAENIIIPVALVPVGSAASLPATLPSSSGGPVKLTIPKRNVYEVIKDKPLYLYKATTTTIAPPAEASRTSIATEKVLVHSAITSRSVLTPVTRLERRRLVRGSPTPNPEPPSTEPQGPDNNPVSFWGDFIYSDVDFESQIKITSVNLNIYPDKNPQSGVFYYLPIAYDIKYDAEKGFAFNIDYGTARSEGTESKVRMSGTLASGISLYEVQFIKNLMEAYRKQNPGLKLEKPLPLPVRETPVITLGDELKNFGITSVNINNVNSITDPIEFSWLTDGTTAAELENLLKANSGITGKMKIKPQSETLPDQEIPVRIRLLDENTFGRFGMTPAEVRTKNWRNETPFPVRLKYMHYMIIDKNSEGKDSPIIYSWDLNEQEVQPRMQVKFD